MDSLILAGTGIGITIVNFIFVKILNRISYKNYSFFWKRKSQSIEIKKTKVDITELKRRLRIVVIDDEDSFPVKLFQEAGYSVDKWDKVENYSKLERGFYDIIVLDITGIAQHISANDGLGVLEDLKAYNPSQIIIAYSQHSFDLSKAKFWQMSDDQIAKPSDFLKIKRSIENLIENKFTPLRYLGLIDELIQRSDLNIKEKNMAKKYLTNIYNSNEDINKNKLLELTKSNMDLVSKILTLSNAVTKFFN